MKTDILTDQKPAAKNAGFQKNEKTNHSIRMIAIKFNNRRRIFAGKMEEKKSFKLAF